MFWFFLLAVFSTPQLHIVSIALRWCVGIFYLLCLDFCPQYHKHGQYRVWNKCVTSIRSQLGDVEETSKAYNFHNFFPIFWTITITNWRWLQKRHNSPFLIHCLHRFCGILVFTVNCWSFVFIAVDSWSLQVWWWFVFAVVYLWSLHLLLFVGPHSR